METPMCGIMFAGVGKCFHFLLCTERLRVEG